MKALFYLMSTPPSFNNSSPEDNKREPRKRNRIEVTSPTDNTGHGDDNREEKNDNLTGPTAACKD